MLYNTIKHVLPRFCFHGEYCSVEELVSGNINSTYHLVFREGERLNHYILQQINSYVFPAPDAVMSNISLVCNFLRQSYVQDGIDPYRRMLEFIELKNGQILYEDEKKNFWRAYRYIDNACAYDTVEKPEHFYEAGRGFGEFQRRLSGFPADQLVETIPGFHDTRRRFYTFVAAVANDRAGRVAEVEKEIDFFFDRRKMMCEIVKMIDQGILPLRVTHNDTKINNVMTDLETGRAICVIDLDTVMPGSVLFDYGDAIRFGASTAAEDEADLSKISLNMDLFDRFTQGFLSELKGILTPAEIQYLPLGIKVITCELAMRFLTDYLDGDLYFRIHSPRHNLVRARAQMQLLRDIESKYDLLCDRVIKLAQK